MPDNNLKSNYARLLFGFLATVRKASLYPAKHPVVVFALKNLSAELSGILKAKNPLTINISPDSKVLIEGESIEEAGAITKEIVPYFKKLSIENLTFHAGITEEELTGFIKIIISDPSQVKKSGDINKTLIENNIRHIQIDLFSYIKVKKDEETLLVKAEIPFLGDFKSKIKEFFKGQLKEPQERESIEKEIFRIVGLEFREKKGLSYSTKNILKKFLNQVVDKEAALFRLKNFLLESGSAPQEGDNFIDRIEGEAFKKPREKKRTSGEENEELKRENKELKLQLIQLEEE